MSADASETQAQKKQLRKQAFARRRTQGDREDVSRRILARLAAQPEYHEAQTVLFYVDMRSEVQTRPFLPAALASGRTVVVPHCAGAELELFRLEALEELALGTFQILEPRPELRRLPEKRVAAESLDLVVVPGVAFDRRGARLGYGAGYYDRLLKRVRPDSRLLALAFECQLFPELPVEAHDVLMDLVITEAGLYPGQRARPGKAE